MQFHVVQLFSLVAEKTKYFVDDLHTAQHLEALSPCESNIIYPCFSPSRTEVADMRRDTWCHMRNSGFQTFQAPDLDQGGDSAVCGVTVQVPRGVLTSPVYNLDLGMMMGMLVMLLTSWATLALPRTKHWLQLLTLNLSQSSSLCLHCFAV